MIEPITIICPTYTATDKLQQFVYSIMQYHHVWPFELIIVNNGKAPIEEMYRGVEHIKVLTMPKNLGWEGGLKEGLKHTKSKYVMFANDDIFVPRSSSTWLRDMQRILDYWPEVGAVGPSSNVVMGPQNIFAEPNAQFFKTQFLVGFCVLFRRAALDDIGGIDDTLPGGDDLDYSIRLRLKNWGMVVLKDVFVYHHGFQTGNKLHGDHTVKNGWNSPQMTERTNNALIKKHGFLSFWETIVPQQMTQADIDHSLKDTEGDVVKALAKGKVCELGVGGKKTVEDSIGVDRVEKGKVIPWVGEVSQADVVADVTETLPFKDEEFDTVIARHILEHCENVIKTLKEWKRIIKPGGRLIVAVPDERISDGIPMNPEHRISFTPDFLTDLGSACGLKAVQINEKHNFISFIVVFEKEVA